MALFLLSSIFSGSVVAQIALESIDFRALPGERFEIQLLFDGVPPEPEIFEVTSPARLSMDFAGVASHLEARRFPLQFPIASSVMVLESQERTRMVVNLVEPTIYSSRVQGNRMFVVIGDESAAANSVAARTSAQGTVTRATSAGQNSDIANVDFHRGEDGGGQIVIALNDSSIVGNLERVGTSLELEFANARLANALQERLDVRDFGTPVQYINVYSEDGVVMVVSEIQGDYEYVAFQGNREYIINIIPLAAAVVNASANGLPSYNYSEGTISLNYPNIPIRDALRLLADFNDFNLVVSDTVGGNTTLRLKDTPWDQALDLVLRSGGLDRRMEGNVMYVAPAEEIIAREISILENLQQTETLSPLQTEYIEVNYAVASEIQAFLGSSDGGGGFLSERGSVSVDARTNTLIVQDVASVLVDVREMLAKLDVPVRQVLIEARIVNAETSFGKQLGIRWSGLQSFDSFTLGGDLSSVISGSQNLLVDLGVPTASSSIALGHTDSKGMLALELSALEDSGNGEVVSQPSVVTLDQQMARIESGVQIPYQGVAGGTAGGSTTEFIDAVLSLEVTPQITPDGRIVMLLDIHQDSVLPVAGGGVPAISTNVVTTRVLVDDGDTIVLGGVFREELSTAVSKTIILGDLPYIGGLFRRTSTTETKTELLIFITPSIIKEF